MFFKQSDFYLFEVSSTINEKQKPEKFYNRYLEIQWSMKTTMMYKLIICISYCLLKTNWHCLF